MHCTVEHLFVRCSLCLIVEMCLRVFVLWLLPCLRRKEDSGMRLGSRSIGSHFRISSDTSLQRVLVRSADYPIINYQLWVESGWPGGSYRTALWWRRGGRKKGKIRRGSGEFAARKWGDEAAAEESARFQNSLGHLSPSPLSSQNSSPLSSQFSALLQLITY